VNKKQISFQSSIAIILSTTTAKKTKQGLPERGGYVSSIKKSITGR
jgi:hypothetical protein